MTEQIILVCKDEKPSMSMVNLGKNIQWWWSGCGKTIEKLLKAMVLRKKNITIQSLSMDKYRAPWGANTLNDFMPTSW